MSEGRVIVTLTTRARESLLAGEEGHPGKTDRSYVLRLDFPADHGQDFDDYITTAYEAAQATGMVHDSVHALGVLVEWAPLARGAAKDTA